MKKLFYLFLVLNLIIGLFGCKFSNEDKSSSTMNSNNNPTVEDEGNKQISIFDFYPKKATAGSKLIITGQNFPTDPSAIQVIAERTVFGTEVPLNIISIRSDQIIVKLSENILSLITVQFSNYDIDYAYCSLELRTTTEFVRAESTLKIIEPVTSPINKITYFENHEFITFTIKEAGNYLIFSSGISSYSDIQMSLFESIDISNEPLIKNLNERSDGGREVIQYYLENKTYTLQLKLVDSEFIPSTNIMIQNQNFKGFLSCNFFSDITRGYCMDLSLFDHPKMCQPEQQSYNDCGYENPTSGIVGRCTYFDDNGPLTKIYYNNSAKPWDKISAKDDCEIISEGINIFSDTFTGQSSNELSFGISNETLLPGSPPQFQILLQHSESTNPTSNNNLLDIEKINITINEINTVDENGQNIIVSNTPFSLDLMSLNESTPLEVANVNITGGKYCKIKLVFAENNTVTVGGIDKQLMTPSSSNWQSGFKLNSQGCINIIDDNKLTLYLDFNPKDSLVYNPGKDRYILRPVIKIANTSIEALNTYNMEAWYKNNSDIIVAQFNTKGNVRWLTSENSGRTVFDGRWTFNKNTNIISIDYEIFVSLGSDTFQYYISSAWLPTYYLTNMAENYSQFELLDYDGNLLKLKNLVSGEIYSFYGRNTFGPFEDF